MHVRSSKAPEGAGPMAFLLVQFKHAVHVRGMTSVDQWLGDWWECPTTYYAVPALLYSLA
jgi:hypothetical protein